MNHTSAVSRRDGVGLVVDGGERPELLSSVARLWPRELQQLMTEES